MVTTQLACLLTIVVNINNTRQPRSINFIFSAGQISLISSVCTDAYSSYLQYSIDLFIRYLGQYNGYKD